MSDSAKPKRAPAGPRPCFVVFNQPLPEDVHVVQVSRKADDALRTIAEQGIDARSILRIEVK